MENTEVSDFKIDPNGVDPKLVPMADISGGAKIPMIGLGTFGSDHVTPQEIADAVLGAASVGYRHFDCAAVYGNEPEIGKSLKKIIDAGVKREDLWITSKLFSLINFRYLNKKLSAFLKGKW